MQITVEEKQPSLVIKLAGHMGHASVNELRRVFDEWLAKGSQNFIVDMGGLQYINSAGLRCFFEVSKKINALKGKLLFCGIQSEVRQIFDVSGFTSLFSICDTVESAAKQI
ncbi:MAG: STAS domain-containing protein [Kiritimatiellae bacterium]|jgi:anti-anti-sigma factor|nr:STAS domain-containing protein [Kiritimatiellia bacterium]